MTVWRASYTHLFGNGQREGHVARTVEAGPDMAVDLDAAGRVLGVETSGDDLNWTQALVKLAVAGRLTVSPGSSG